MRLNTRRTPSAPRHRQSIARSLSCNTRYRGATAHRTSRSVQRRSSMAKTSSILSVVVMLLIGTHPAYSQSQSACGDQEKRDWLRNNVRALMQSDDSTTSADRRLHHLSLVHPDSIVFVDDARICERAARVYYRYRLGPRPPHGVAAARVGKLFVVYGDERA